MQTWAGDPAISFEAELIGSASSRDSGKTRWSELQIYRTGSGAYVVTGVGRSTVDEERDLHWIRVSRTAKDALKSLIRRGKGGPYLTNVALDAIDEAANTDASI